MKSSVSSTSPSLEPFWDKFDARLASAVLFPESLLSLDSPLNSASLTDKFVIAEKNIENITVTALIKK